MKERKMDRMARILSIEHLLYQNPDGLKVRDIARLCKVCHRTVYRDVAILERELRVPMWQDKGKWGIVEGYFLPPIRFTLLEAMTVFIAARLLLEYSNAYNPSIASSLMKLNSIVPVPLRNQIQKTIEWMEMQKKNERFLRTLEVLARAWVDGCRVRIWYQSLGKELAERVIEPYFIQPAALEHANYVIAYCHRANRVLIFKIERIERIELLGEKYTVPEDFDANKHLGSAWGITAHGEVQTIKLKFNPVVGRIAKETTWHPSQVTERQPDGSAMVTMNLSLTVELEAFILGWAEKVEVLEPEELRDKIARAARATVNIYKRK